MDRGQSFIAYAQSPKLMQPGDSAFDYPPGFAKIAAMRCSAFGNLVINAALLQCQTMGATIVGTIGLKGLGLFQRPPALSSNWVDAIYQWQQLRDVMPVGLGQNDIDRDTLRVDEEVVLAARLTAIGWVRSTFFPPCTARTDELSATTREKSSLSAPRNLSKHAVELAPYAGLLPGTHPAPASHAGAAPHFLWQHFPRNSRLQNKQDARQYASIIQRLAARMRLAPPPDWKQWLDYFPQFIINQFVCHIASPR